MKAGGPSLDGDPSSVEPAGPLELVARVLNQLSLSAWLPAAYFTAVFALILQFKSQRNLEVDDALRSLGGNLWLLALLTLPLLVIVTLLTQALSFEAIRLLEGYWRRPPLAGPAAAIALRYQSWRLHRLDQLIRSRTVEAWAKARGRWLDMEDQAVVDLLEGAALGLDVPNDCEPDDLSRALALDWRQACDPAEMRRLETLRVRRAEFPEEWRLLTTRLGNVLRATEDQLDEGADDLETFSYRGREILPHRLRVHHDQFRTRLDMYCTLTIVSLVAGVLAGWQLVPTVHPDWRVWAWISALGLILAAAVSYHAAIASAKGYTSILREMDRRLTN